jgi:1-acyl-sn-glycerol-3-phosphate acyltransferase
VLYTIFKVIFAFILKVFGRYQVFGRQNLPDSGPLIIVSNHISNWDPLMVGVAIPRRVSFIAKEELFGIPLVGSLLKAWGMVPIKRGRIDREALSKPLELLKDKKVIGIFIEGKRNLKNPDTMLKPQPGAAMLTLRSGAPIVPVAVINTNRILRSFKRVKVFIGKPILFASKTELEGLEKKEQYSKIGRELTETIQELYRKGRQ